VGRVDAREVAGGTAIEDPASDGSMGIRTELGPSGCSAVEDPHRFNEILGLPEAATEDPGE
jgi:hypothetical protein